jgi:hypothetical protein
LLALLDGTVEIAVEVVEGFLDVVVLEWHFLLRVCQLLALVKQAVNGSKLVLCCVLNHGYLESKGYYNY